MSRHVKAAFICALILISSSSLYAIPNPEGQGEGEGEAPSPTIYHISPTSGPIGTAVTMTGSALGSAYIKFKCNAQAITTTISNDSVIAIVPPGAVTGTITATHFQFPLLGSSSSQIFTVTDGIGPAPIITSISPTSGPIGTTVTVTGFNLRLSNAPQVRLNDIVIPYTREGCTSLVATVPSGATTGLISVSTPLGNAVSPQVFTVTNEAPPPSGTLPTTPSRKGSSKKDSPLQMPSRSSGGESGPTVKPNPAAGNIPGIQMPTMHGGTPCCSIVANGALKGRLGRVVVAFPGGAVPKSTSVEVLKDGKKLQSGYGNKSWELPSGTYEVSISGKQVPNVTVKAGHDTTVKVGVLRVSASKGSSVDVLDGGHKLTSGYGDQIIGLPPGAFDLKVAGQTQPVTISEGQVTDF